MKVLSFSYLTARKGGFTLLEVVAALGITGTMLTTIFLMADTTVRVTHSLVEVQSEEITRDAFFRLLERHFKELPGNCRMELEFSQAGPGGRYLSEMTFQNTPISFNWGGQVIAAKAVRISTRPEVEGGLSIVLSYYEEEVLDSGVQRQKDAEPVAELVLLSNVHLFEWRVFDGNSWTWDWNQPQRRPIQAELITQFSGSTEQYRRVFWIPKKQDPGQYIRSKLAP